MLTEEIVVLARSKKYGGRCIAGISFDSGEWVRPVSGLSIGQLLPSHCAVNGDYPRNFDIVRFEHLGPVGDPAQPENVRLAGKPWIYVGAADRAEAYEALQPLVVPGPELLGNRGRSVPDSTAREGIPASLALVEPQSVRFALEQRGEKISPRTYFTIGGWTYDLPLTDYLIRPRLARKGLGKYSFGDLDLQDPAHLLMTISLGEPVSSAHPYRYKLVAAVLPIA